MMRCTFFSCLTCPVFFFFFKITRPSNIFEFSKLPVTNHEHDFLPGNFCLCDYKLTLFSKYFGNHFHRHDSPSQAYRFNKNVPTRSPVQKRLSIYNWNPGPRRGKEASQCVDHDILTYRFHVAHYGGCAILCNKDDTRRDLPDQVMEGDQVWVMQGVLSRASFRRPPLSGQKNFYRCVSTS